MQQVCIHVGLTRKQNREGRGERWYGGCSSRAASLGRRNSSWPVFLVVLADVRWFRPWTGWRWTRSPVRYLCGRKEWESGSASYIRCCNMSRLPDDDDVWDIAVLRASPVSCKSLRWVVMMRNNGCRQHDNVDKKQQCYYISFLPFHPFFWICIGFSLIIWTLQRYKNFFSVKSR